MGERRNGGSKWVRENDSGELVIRIIRVLSHLGFCQVRMKES